MKNLYSSYSAMPFYPGPTSVHPRVMEAMNRDFAPPRFSMEYTNLYLDTAKKLQQIIETKSEIIIPTGEAMLTLWGALRSCLKHGDTVLSVGNGVFGDGFGDMAEILGCKIEKVSFPYNTSLDADALAQIDEAIVRSKPKMITAIHCETPSGTLNPLAELGKIKKNRGVPLFVVDAVSSVGGVKVSTDEWNCDLLLGGVQKCFSCPPFMSFLSVSDVAWDIIKEVNYIGYDAFLAFHEAHKDPRRFPYTPSWIGVAGLHAACEVILEEGLENVYNRHIEVANICRNGLQELGVELWAAPNAINSPSVTAAKVPSSFTWNEWKKALANKDVYVGGSLGPMQDKVFRFGHMGTQANKEKMQSALNVVRDLLK